MKLEFLKKLNAKVIAIAAAAAVFVIGGGTAIALATTSRLRKPGAQRAGSKSRRIFPCGGQRTGRSFLRIDKGHGKRFPVYEIDFTTAEKAMITTS